jgi:hypothetical protein
VPADDGYVFNVNGAELYAESASSDFYAPIQLPHGSTIRGISFYWYDASVYQAFITMKRASLDGSSDNTLATLSSSGSGGYGNATTAVPDEIVDNSVYTYYLNLTLSNGSQGALLRFRGAVVECEMSQPF